MDDNQKFSFRKCLVSQRNEIDEKQLEVIGVIPQWLNGSLFRNGPGAFEYPNKKLIHWFDGPAMVHKFTFKDGTMSYQNKFVQTDIYTRSNEQGKMSATEYGTDYRTFVQKIRDFILMRVPRMSDNVNVNFLRIKNDLLAITGGQSHFQLDAQTLDTLGQYSFIDDADFVITGQTPHPSLDTTTGDIYNIGFNFMKNEYVFFKIPKGTRERKIVAILSTDKISDIHSFATTKNYIVFIEIPWVLNTKKLLLQYSYLDSLEWVPERGTMFVLVDKRTGAVQKIPYAEPLSFGHTANAFEKDGMIIVDMPYFSKSNINDMRIERILKNGQDIRAYNSVSRFYINTEEATVRKEKITDTFIELETINYAQHNEKEYRYMYGPSQLADSKFFDRLVKIDVQTKHVQSWVEKHTFPGEPIFVPHPNASTEDEGVLLTVFFDGSKEVSFMQILDAQSFTELARIYVPQHIPFGFHGQFYKGDDI